MAECAEESLIGRTRGFCPCHIVECAEESLSAARGVSVSVTFPNGTSLLRDASVASSGKQTGTIVLFGTVQADNVQMGQ